MTLYAANFIEHLESFQGREYDALFRGDKFRFLFHDTTKLRIRLPDRDISIPLSMLLISINQLLARKKVSKEICEKLNSSLTLGARNAIFTFYFNPAPTLDTVPTVFFSILPAR